MSYFFSVVRFVPDPAKGEFINVAAIAGSDVDESWEVRAVSNWKRARRLDAHGTISAVMAFVSDLQARADAEALDMEEGLSLDAVARMSEELCNVVQVTTPAPVMATSASAALDMVFAELIVDPTRLRFPFAKKIQAVTALKKCYQARHVPAFRDVYVQTGPYNMPFDFAVANGEALQLVRCWSFQLPDQEELVDQVKAWAWGVRALRRAGGAQVFTEEGKEFVARREVDVAAIFMPPLENQIDTSAFPAALDAFRDPETGIGALPAEQADDTARHAAALLSKH